MEPRQVPESKQKRFLASGCLLPISKCFVPCAERGSGLDHDDADPRHDLDPVAPQTSTISSTTGAFLPTTDASANGEDPAGSSPESTNHEDGKKRTESTTNEMSAVKAELSRGRTSDGADTHNASSTETQNASKSQNTSSVPGAVEDDSSMPGSMIRSTVWKQPSELMPPAELDPSLPKPDKTGDKWTTAAAVPTASRSLGSREKSGTITIRMDQFKQTMKGIGYSNAFYTNWWHTKHPNSWQIYNKIFHDLRPAILRLRNAFSQDEYSERDMKIDQEFLQTASRLLGYKPEILLTGWSPPVAIKASGRLNAGTNDSKLAKNEKGVFKYKEFANFWVKSLEAYEKMGIVPTYFSVQNEPDYNPGGHPGALFSAKEAWHTPGYYRAADQVYDVVKKKLGKVPKMIGPEGFAADSYLDDFPYGSGKFSAFASHLYASGDKSNPWSFTGALHRVKRIAEEKNISEVYMTEYAKLGQHEYTDPLRLAIVMHNTLTIADCQMYLHWDGCWGANTTGNEGTLLLVDNPFADQRKWSNKDGYRVLHSFYWFQHFSLFIRPGYRRVVCDAIVEDGGVLASAWSGPSGQFAIIVINIDQQKKNITLKELPEWVHLQPTQLYYSTLDKGFTHKGEWKRDRASKRDLLELLPESITTIYSSSTG